MVECGGLENRYWGFSSVEGSNPSPSAPSSASRCAIPPVGLTATRANPTVMTTQTHLERRLDRLIAHAVTPRRAAAVIAVVTIVITVAAGVLMTVVDHKGFPSIGSGLWWAVQTVTTVGYGDHVPETAAGQIMAAIVMLLGIGFVTVITASITGAFVALALALDTLRQRDVLRTIPLSDYVAAISVGVVDGEPLLDLAYEDDSRADVDMNIVKTGDGRFIEIQGTAEATPFGHDSLLTLLTLADHGIKQLIEKQRAIVGQIVPNREGQGSGFKLQDSIPRI